MYKRLIFNNGVTADIPKQPKNSKAAIFSRERKDTWGQPYTDTDAALIKGGIFKGTPKRDYFQLYGNEGSLVDVADTNASNDTDDVTLTRADKGSKYGPNNMYSFEGTTESKGNQIKMNANDEAELSGNKNYVVGGNEDNSGIYTLAENSYPDNEAPETKKPAEQTPAESDKPDIAKGNQDAGSDIAAVDKNKK